VGAEPLTVGTVVLDSEKREKQICRPCCIGCSFCD
jgi:hypothetical protein